MNSSRNFAGNLTFWDAIVDADGLGDYTSVATALSTEGTDARIFVKQGSYTETNPIVLAGQIIHWDDVTMTLSGSTLNANGNGSRMTGKLELTGTGNASYRSLIDLTNNNTDLDWENCEIKLTPSGAGLTTAGSSGTRIVDLGSGGDNKFCLKIEDLTFSNSTTQVDLFWLSNATSFVDIYIDTITTAQNQDLNGVNYQDTFDKNSVKLLVNAVTCTGSGTGTGAKGTGDNNCFYGVIKSCDTNLSDTGTANNTAALNTT